jgi:hypothetical protein
VSAVGRRATLRLSLACDNRCVFCAQRGLADDGAAGGDLGERLAALRAGADEITFVGGEPTLHDALTDAIAAARAAGFRAVGVQTNGRRLADVAFAERLVAAGLGDVHLSIHAAAAAAHDYHTGVEGSWRAALAGMAAVRALGAAVVVTTVLTRSNFRGLADLPALLAARGAAAWQIAVPQVAGGAMEAFDRVVPRLGMAIPFALHALDAARTRGLPAFIGGAPLCALGPFAARALPPEAERPRAFAPACDGCAARTGCPGADPAYLARWNGDELAPRDPPAAVADAALARLFVGVGEVAPPAPPSATPAARRLPVLGKAQPARAEVTAGTPRRSGEALREILPDLFAEK